MRPRGLVVVALLCALAACGAPPAGTPAPPSATAAPSATSRVVLPPRPRAVDLTGVDPCALIDRSQRTEFGFDQSPVPNQYPSPVYVKPVRACSVISMERGSDARFLISEEVGIEAWTSGDIDGSLQPVSIGGFPAVTAIAADQTSPFCTVAVDVAPHTALDVQFGENSADAADVRTRICGEAQRAAALALNALTTTMGR